MKAVIAAALAATMFHSAQAQMFNVPVICEEPETVDKVLKEYKEQPYFVGLDKLHNGIDLTVSVFLNQQTGTYSVVFIVPNSNKICVMSSGEKGKILHQQ